MKNLVVKSVIALMASSVLMGIANLDHVNASENTPVSQLTTQETHGISIDRPDNFLTKGYLMDTYITIGKNYNVYDFADKDWNNPDVSATYAKEGFTTRYMDMIGKTYHVIEGYKSTNGTQYYRLINNGQQLVINAGAVEGSITQAKTYNTNLVYGRTDVDTKGMTQHEAYNAQYGVFKDYSQMNYQAGVAGIKVPNGYAETGMGKYTVMLDNTEFGEFTLPTGNQQDIQAQINHAIDMTFDQKTPDGYTEPTKVVTVIVDVNIAAN